MLLLALPLGWQWLGEGQLEDLVPGQTGAAARSAEMALVVASSKASECDPSWYAYTSSEPICLRPLGVDDRLAAALGAQAIVDTYAASETEYARKLFYDSLLAAYTMDEVRALLDMAGVSSAQVAATSDRHLTVWIDSL